MFRYFLFCSSVVLVFHLSTISGSPISQTLPDDPATTTDSNYEIYVRDEEDKTGGVTDKESIVPPTAATVIIFRQEAEEDEDDSEEEGTEDREPGLSPASGQSAVPSPQAPVEGGNPQEGNVQEANPQENNQQEANPQEINPQEANPQETNPQEVQVQPQEPDEGQNNPEVGQISQQEAVRPPVKRPVSASAAPKPVLANSEVSEKENPGNIFPEFGESIIPEPSSSVAPSGLIPVQHVGPEIKPPGGAAQQKRQPALPIQEYAPVGDAGSLTQLSEFEEENDSAAVVLSSAAPVVVATSTSRTTTGKYKITITKGTTLESQSTTTVPPPGGSFAEEWNNTNSIFMLSPQGRKDCECGKIPFKVDDADKAGINEFPWTVAIVRTGIFGGGRPHCGGVLIADTYVLSAAHCFSGLYADSMQVWLTAHNSLQSIDNFIHSDRVVKRDISEIIMHPNYESRSYDNDIALLKLTQPVDISTSSYYVPACLPAGVGSYEGMQARIAGWGSAASPSNTNNRLTPNKMCKDDVPIITNEVCNRDTTHKNKITSNHMCAGLLTRQPTDSCLGDSGGPLMLPNNGRYTVIGITSHGYAPRRAYTPVVYTKVGNYADWILHQTRDADWCSL